MPPRHPLYSEAAEEVIVRYDYDPEKARQLMAEAGFEKGSDGILVNEDGYKLDIKLETTAGNQLRELFQQFIAEQWWDNLGVRVTIENRPAGAFFASQRFYGREWPHMVMFAWASGPTVLPNGWHSQQIPTEENSFQGQNIAGWSNPEADAIIEEIGNTLSEAKRQELAVDLLRLWSEDLPSISLFYRVDVSTWKPSIVGIKPTGSNAPDTWNSWEWDIQ